MTDAARPDLEVLPCAAEPRGGRALAAALREDRLLYLVITLYVLAAAMVWWPHRWSIGAGFFSYVGWWAQLASGLFCIYVPLAAGWRVLRSRPARPVRGFFEAVLAVCTPRLFAGLILYIALGFALGAFTTLKPMLPLLQPFRFDVPLADLDARLHGGEPWTLLQAWLGSPDVTRAIGYLYVPVWGTLATYTPLPVAALCRDRVLRTQYLLALVVSLFVYGSLLAGLFMSGGPAFYAEITGDAERFAAVRDYLQQFTGEQFAAWDLQRTLWDGYLQRRSGFGLGISAFPSVHVTCACLLALLAWRLNRLLGAAAWLFAAATMVGSVHLGWHYAVESWFILLTIWPVWALCGEVARRSAPGD